MEPGHRAPEEVIAAAAPEDLEQQGSATTIRLVAACVLLFGLAFVQDPGFLVADTKFDLVAAPADFLSRALHLWDGEAAFGQLQNQAYGYLWPMGPFFLLGSVLDLPGWVIQRLWMGLVMSVAFVGTAKVARALGVRSDFACFVAAFAFALSPRMLTTLGPISIEAWPSALAPWVLLPLIRGSVSGSPRRAAALSALAVAMVGGVNAAATFAVIPLGVVWILTRTPGPRRRRLMLWWPVFTLLGTLWWLIPLFLLGAYSPPFLDFIETASITTFPTTVFDALRGTSAWVPYIDGHWRAGNDLITDFYLPLNSGVVLLFGFVGLMSRRNQHRQFLVLSVLLGLLMVTAGHMGSTQGWFAADVRASLDGLLAPLRNVHKFDPVVRLPLVLGLAWAVESVWTRVHAQLSVGAAEKSFTHASHRFQRRVLLGLAVVAVAGASVPALMGRVAPTGGFLVVPDHWQETADWLAAEPGPPGLALLVPGSSFGSYEWGNPRDEPMQFLAESAWAVRNAVPLAPPGNVRMLDEIEKRFAQGEPSTGLADYLRRAGVRHLVVRNDLKRSNDVPDPVLVHQVLQGSPGLERVASFGPVVGGDGHLDRPGERVVINDGWQARYPAVEIFEVTNPGARAVSSERLPVVGGGPEDLLDLADLGLVGQSPTQLAVDADAASDPAGPVILTDGLQQRERFFGRVHDGVGPVATPGDSRRTGNPVSDYELDNHTRWSTTARLTGARAVSASSSQADATSVGGARPGTLPYAALDGSVDSAWVSAAQGEPPWWKLTLDEPIPVSQVRLTGGTGASETQLLRVRTAGQVTEPFELGPDETRTIRFEPDRTPWVRVEGVPSEEGRQITLSEVDLGGLNVQRSLVLPVLPEAWRAPEVIVLRTLGDARTGCVTVHLTVPCTAERARAPEEQVGMSRIIPLREPGRYEPRVLVRPRAGEALEGLLQRGQLIKASASSSGVPDARASAIAAVDGDPGTTWVADADDLRPSLDLSWVGEKQVSGLRLGVSPDAPARTPRSVTLKWPEGELSVILDEDGRARFDPIRTDQLKLFVDTSEQVSTLDFDGGSATPPIGLSELRLFGVPHLPLILPDTPRKFGCGTGPTLRVNGVAYETAVEAVPRDLFAMQTVPARVCTTETLGLPAGENEVDVLHSDAFAVDSVVLDAGLGGGFAQRAAVVRSSGPVDRVVAPAPNAHVLAVRENVNRGWRATQAGEDLDPIVVDGWQQGWSIPSGDADVRVDFVPDGPYRLGMVVGLLSLIALVVALLMSPRRRGARLPALSGRRLPASLFVGIALLQAGLLVGTIGVVTVAVTLVLGGVLRRRDEEAAAWVLSGTILVSAAAYGIRPWGGSDGWAGGLAWPHYLVMVSLAGAVLLALEVPPRARGRLRRMAGRSSTR